MIATMTREELLEVYPLTAEERLHDAAELERKTEGVKRLGLGEGWSVSLFQWLQANVVNWNW